MHCPENISEDAAREAEKIGTDSLKKVKDYRKKRGGLCCFPHYSTCSQKKPEINTICSQAVYTDAWQCALDSSNDYVC